MVEINLIRQRYVLPLQRQEKREHFLALTAVVLLLLLVSSATIGSIYSFNKIAIRNYSRQAEKADSLRSAAFFPTPEEQARLAALRKAAAFSEKQILFAPRLAALSGLTPKGTYISSIRFNGTSAALIGLCQPGKDAGASLALFLKGLNESRDFTQGGGRLGLESSTDKSGLVSFTISGALK